MINFRPNPLFAEVLAGLSRGGLAQVPAPPWLRKAKWRPAFCLRKHGDDHLVAVDIIPSGAIPKVIYKGEVVPLMRGHTKLRVLVCICESGFEGQPHVEDLCKELGLGLKVILQGLGLQTVVPLDLERVPGVPAPAEAGWFPSAILSGATGLRRLKFSPIIDRFVRKVRRLGSDEKATRELVVRTIDELLRCYPTCHAGIGSFMKLAHFEDILRMAAPDSSEHVCHSFRLFLAGCCILDRFYDHFKKAQARFSRGRSRDVSVEYCWLLAAIFHDVGRREESASRMVEQELGEDDISVRVTWKDAEWTKEPFKQARRILSSLGSFVARCPDPKATWDGGAIEDEHAKLLGERWTVAYGEMNHAAVGAFKLLAEVIDKAYADDETKNRAFVIGHAAPAALAILLHDWRLWEEGRKWKLVPIDGAAIPLAALLVFLDTWDDYRRKPGTPSIQVTRYVVGDTGAEVTVTWPTDELYAKEGAELKYESFGKVLKNMPFALHITGTVAGTL